MVVPAEFTVEPAWLSRSCTPASALWNLSPSLLRCASSHDAVAEVASCPAFRTALMVSCAFWVTLLAAWLPLLPSQSPTDCGCCEVLTGAGVVADSG